MDTIMNFAQEIVDVSDPESSGEESEDSRTGSNYDGAGDDSEDDGFEADYEVVNAEKEIEGDFDRLVQDIRQRNDTSLTKDWDITIQEQDAEFLDDLRAASGIGRRKKKKGRTVGPTLSHQVKALLGDGNQAFVDSNLPSAIGIMQEVIRIEPRAAQAWSVLAQCFEDLKQPQKALQLRIMAAHLRHDAEEWDKLAMQSKELGYHQQALYCYRKVYSLDPSNVGALWDRASLAKEIGDLRTARHSLLAILKLIPHDLNVLSEIRTILIELNDLVTCADLFQKALDYYQARIPSGVGPALDPGSSTLPSDVSGGGFNLLNILVLADLYNTLGEYEKGIQVIKRGCRWLQGRMDQKYWDLFDDDREYDTESVDRSGRGSDKEPTTRPSGNIDSGRFTLDVNARHRLAVARIKMGDVEEGIMHANIVLNEDIFDYAPLFSEIADAYFERSMFTEARPIYEMLGADSSTSSVYILMQTAGCLRALDEIKEASEIYEHVRTADPNNNEAKMKLAEIYEILNEPRKALDLVYQVIDSRKRRAKEPQATPVPGAPSSSLFTEDRPAKSKSSSRSQNRLSQAQLKELEAEKEKEVLKGYRRVTDIWEAMLKEREEAEVELAKEENWKAHVKRMMEVGTGKEGPMEREWMIEAEKLVEIFRETRNLFLASRNNPFRGMFPKRSAPRRPKNQEEDEERMASRLQLDLEGEKLSRRANKVDGVDIFRGVSFKDWLRLIMQYCFILARRSQYELADEVLRHILMSNAYLTSEYQVVIRLALLACAIYNKNYSVVVEQCRKLITQNQFNNEMYRLLMASLSSGLRPTDFFITSTLQKFLFREMKLIDMATNNPDALKWNPINKRYAPAPTGRKSADVQDEPEDDSDGPGDDVVSTANPEKLTLPTKNNPLVVAIYGQMCVAAKSYQSAIFYLLHAYDYCPNDPMICLSLAIASIGRAMQRQSDNRHHLIAQGMAFLSKYRLLRGSDPAQLSEVDFNFGRAFQQLGLHSHAIKHYERVLEMAENDQTGVEHLAKEAAYNLSLVYVTTGATPLADRLYRRWLSL
ncbi:TPR-like protein [Dendrothele bispora CBS 962.96]|uniref:TPR-like protein n=1 Tax=Dendrothele bispora (strain CBS 962.96) TaxID=1314807 RepID=A0A4S8MLX4_DENBC|nr:TPR-like protein [Dendrothele bispora CBS 962.96]